jgi:hypothetical protein
VHFIKARDVADGDPQITEMIASGKVGPRDGFLSLTGYSVRAEANDRLSGTPQIRALG